MVLRYKDGACNSLTAPPGKILYIANSAPSEDTLYVLHAVHHAAPPEDTLYVLHAVHHAAPPEDTLYV